MIIIYFSDVSSPYDTSIHFRIFKSRPCQTFKRAQNKEIIQSSRHKIPQLNFSVANSALSSFLKIFFPESCKHWNIACEIIILMVFLNNFSLLVITMTFFHSKSILAIEESIFYSIYEYFNSRKPCRHSSFWQFFRFVMIESVCFFNKSWKMQFLFSLSPWHYPTLTLIRQFVFCFSEETRSRFTWKLVG